MPGIPEETEFASKPRLAQAMIGRTLEAGAPFAWFTADEAYGQAKWLQAWLEERDVSYVMAIRRSDTLTTAAGEQRADALIAALRPQSRERISAGAGAHGPCEYDWALVPVRPGWKRSRGYRLLARRSLSDPDEIPYKVARTRQCERRRARGRRGPRELSRTLDSGTLAPEAADLRPCRLGPRRVSWGAWERERRRWGPWSAPTRTAEARTP